MTRPIEHPLEAAIDGACPAPNWRDSHVLLAVSGGPDSVALLRAVLALKQRDGGPGQLFVAHLHHGLRGAAADEDQTWLSNLCRRLEIPLEVGRADVITAAAEQGDGCEAAARQARYDFLRTTAEKLGARYVAVGHTADDQVETVLHRIFRGTGLAGLAGMPNVRTLSPSVTLVRPMLDVRRDDVLRYLEAIGQDYRTDASNADCRWTRNRLRNELLPAIRAHVNVDADKALRRLALQAGEAQQLVSQAAIKLALQCVTFDVAPASTIVKIDCRQLTGQPRLLVREVCKATWQQAGWPLQAMGFQEWQQLAAMAVADHDAAVVSLPADIQARRDGHCLMLMPQHL